MIEFQLIDDTEDVEVNLIDNTDNIEVELIKEIDSYNQLKDQPSINNVTLTGNKTLHDLGIQQEGDYPTTTEFETRLAQKVDKVTGKGLSTNDYTTPEKNKLASLENYDDTEIRQLIDTKQPRGDYLTEETDPTVPNHVKSITQANITSWNNKADAGDIPTALSDLSDDSTHRLVTDTEKTTWNGKANVSDIPKIFYGTSATGASTAAKVVVCEEFTEADLVAGTRITVLFTNANTYNGQATLNINGTGAKNIYYNGSTTNARYMWVAGETVDFIYNGTQWATINGGLATTSYYGVTKLATGANSDSQAYALTPRSLYYFANYSIAPYYSTSKTYAVGDKVRYTYYIYECITAIDEPESWTAAHWQQIDTIQEQIDAINTTIGHIDTVLTRLTTGSGV